MGAQLTPAAGRRLLIVSWVFAPSQVIGAIRVTKLARYLREDGWDVRVLTAAPELLPFPQTMPVEIPEEEIVRVRYRDPLLALEWQVLNERTRAVEAAPAAGGRTRVQPLRRILRPLWKMLPLNQVRLPDRSTVWYAAAIRAARELFRQWKPDVILSSHGPAGSHIVANRLQRRLGVPWVADYRDPWSGNHGIRYPAAVEWAEARVERAVVRPAAALTTVSEQIAARLGELHGKRVVTIYNGYDEAEYQGTVEPEREFVITYTGQVEARFRDPTPLLEALALMRASGRARLPALRIVGANRGGYLDELARRHGVEDLLRVEGRVTLAESIRIQRGSTVLLSINWAGTPLGGILTGKLMEYLGAGRPVLAVGPYDPGVSDVLGRTRAGVWSDDPAEIASIVGGWMDTWERTGRLEPESDPAQVAQFSRRVQAGRLSALLAEVLEPAGGDGGARTTTGA